MLRLLTSGYGPELDVLCFDPSARNLTKEHATPIPDAPTWCTLSPTRPIIYTGAEFSEPAGELYALAYDANTGTLRPLANGSRAQAGTGPVHFVLSHDGRYLYTANYGGGSLSTVQLDNEGGFVSDSTQTLAFEGTGPNKDRQEAPHVHGVHIDPTGQYLLAADLGADVLRVFDVSAGSPTALPSITLPPGNGPRHLIFSDRSGRTLVYLVEELSNTIAVFEVEYPSDTQTALNLKAIQREVSTLPPNAQDTPGAWTAAELALSPSGAFLYASNRSPVDNSAPSDTLTVFPVAADGSLLRDQATFLPLGGRGPRHFALDPSGRYLAVPLERTSEIVVLEVGGTAGGKEADRREEELTEVARLKGVEQPTCVVWLP